MHSEEEIDLIKLLKSITTFITKNSKKLLLAIIIGLIIGLSYCISIKSIYKSNLVGLSNILTTEDITPIIDKVQNLIEDGNYIELSKTLKLDSNQIKNIKSISVSSEIIPKTKKSDDDIITKKFIIEVTTYDFNLFPELNVAIPDLIRNNEYTKLKTELITYSRKNIYNKLGKEIQLLDSLKTHITPGISMGSKSVFYVADPSAINSTIIKLYEQQMSVYESLNLRPDFQIIESFATLKKPINKKFIRNAMIGGVVCFGLTLIFLIGAEINKRLI